MANQVSSASTATAPDKFNIVVQQARAVLSKSQSGLNPKASSNTATNTNVTTIEKTIGDLADLVENTFDPVFKENYRIALLRTLAAAEKAKAGQRATIASASAISSSGETPETFSHPSVGPVMGLDVSSWTARQAGYQQRFNAPPAAMPSPLLPIDPTAAGNAYNRLDLPGVGTTAIPTVTNPTGSFLNTGKPNPRGMSRK